MISTTISLGVFPRALRTIYEELGRTRRILISPRAFFQGRDVRLQYPGALLLLVTALGISLLILFLTAAMNATALRQAAISAHDTLPPAVRGSYFSRLDLLIPWNRALLPAMFLLYVPAMALLRHTAFRILGENRPSLADLQTLSIYALLPVIAASTLTGAFHNIFPNPPGIIGSFHAVAAFLAGVVSLAAWILEPLIFVRSARAVYSENSGRPAAAWILSWAGVIGFVFVCLLVVMTFGA